jgi:hypothetical protein
VMFFTIMLYMFMLLDLCSFRRTGNGGLSFRSAREIMQKRNNLYSAGIFKKIFVLYIYKETIMVNKIF